MELITPDLAHLPAYRAALARGWSPSNERSALAGEQLAASAADPAGFVAGLDDPEGAGPPVRLPDGSTVPRLPGRVRWIWADGFCGTISFRWQPGTEALPPTCLGHIGYGVVPWRRGEGLATAALRAMLPMAAAEGLAWVEVTTDPGNLASVKVIERAGGVLVERFAKGASYGDGEGLRFRIGLLTGAGAGPSPSGEGEGT